MSDIDFQYKNYNFNVEIEGLGAMGFAEVRAEETYDTPVELREGNVATSFGIKYRDNIKCGNITLKYGLTENKKIYDWLTQLHTQSVEKKNVTIFAFDDNHKDVKATWTLLNAIPCKLQLAGSRANGNEIVIEKIVLVCEGLIRDK